MKYTIKIKISKFFFQFPLNSQFKRVFQKTDKNKAYQEKMPPE